MRKPLLLLTLVALVGCSNQLMQTVGTIEPEDTQAALEPAISGNRIKVWATNYYVHSATHDEKGIDLLSKSGKVLETISAKDWCAGAIEGTVVIRNSQQSNTFNYARLGSKPSVDCRPYVPEKYRTTDWAMALGRTRWALVDAPFGLGTKGYKLVPFKTVAVDPKQFPIGTVLYIPQARGVEYDGPDGLQVHDGYFFAADVGGAITGNHIDVFTGTGPSKAFPFVKSRPSSTFDVIVVNDERVRDQLARMHR